MPSPLAKITKRQLAILQYLHDRGQPSEVRSIQVSQDELAEALNITRQALSNHLRKLRDLDFVRTGRRFIDITSEGLKILGEPTENAFIFIKVKPQSRTNVFSAIQKLKYSMVYRVTGDIDLIAIARRKDLDSFLKKVSKIPGVEGTSAHIVLDQSYS